MVNDQGGEDWELGDAIRIPLELDGDPDGDDAAGDDPAPAD
jgi:hypothetical protein